MEEPHDTTAPPPDAPAHATTSGGGFRTSPFCLHLQSKKTFFLRGPAHSESDLLDASQHCWCRKTMQALGPDGELVDPDDCRAGRSCFESVL